jgi:hypothetical protein
MGGNHRDTADVRRRRRKRKRKRKRKRDGEEDDNRGSGRQGSGKGTEPTEPNGTIPIPQPPEPEPEPPTVDPLERPQTDRWRARFEASADALPSRGSRVTIRPGATLSIMVDGREVGTLVGNEAEFVAGYIRQGYMFSGEISAFDRGSGEGQVEMRGTPPDAA